MSTAGIVTPKAGPAAPRRPRWQARVCKTLVHRGAYQPRRHRGPSPHTRGRGPRAGRDRRDVVDRIMCKQFIMRDAIDVVQIDASCIGGVNEVLAMLLMAANMPSWSVGMPAVWACANTSSTCRWSTTSQCPAAAKGG